MRSLVHSPTFALLLGALVWGAAAVPSLPSAHAASAPAPPPSLSAVLATDLGPSSLPGAQVSAVVLDARTLRVLGALDGTSRMPPGALEAVVTAAAALWRLGPTYRTVTQVLGPPPRQGTVWGDLVLVGGGDPTLDQGGLTALARQLVRQAHAVTGGVEADGQLFAPPRFPLGWPYALASSRLPPAPSALTVQGGRLTVTISPNPQSGRYATVTVSPQGAAQVQGSVLTMPPGTPGGPSVTPSPDGATVQVSGVVDQGQPPTVASLPLPQPARAAARALVASLQAQGLRVAGGVGLGQPVPADTVLASVASPPLATWIPSLLPTAANPTPNPAALENLYVLLCRPTLSHPCGPLEAQEAVLTFLARVGAPPGEAALDGSGLSTEDRLSALAVARVVAVAGLHAWGAALGKAMAPFAPALAGLPPSLRGFYAPLPGGAGVVALLPATHGAPHPRVAVLMVADPAVPAALLRTTLARALADVASPGTAKPAAPNSPLPPALLRVLDLAGPGSRVALTLWPVGGPSPALSVDGETLVPAPGIASLALAQEGLREGSALPTRTRVVAVGTLDGRVLYGSLGLVGGLDPTLSPGDVAQLAQQVAALGLRRVTQGVVVDDGQLPPQVGPDTPWEVVGSPQAPVSDALTAGEGLYTVAVLPAAQVGRPPQVSVVPFAAGVTVQNLARTTATGSPDLTVWPLPDTGEIVLTGTLPRTQRYGVVLLRDAPDPALYAGRVFLKALSQAGVKVAAGVRRQAVPPGAPLFAEHAGPSPRALAAALAQNPQDGVLAADLAALLGGRRGLPGAMNQVQRLLDAPGTPAILGPRVPDVQGLGGSDLVASQPTAHALAVWAAQGSPLPHLLPLLAQGKGAQAEVQVRGALLADGPGGSETVAGYVLVQGSPRMAFVLLAADLPWGRSPSPLGLALARTLLTLRLKSPPPA